MNDHSFIKRDNECQEIFCSFYVNYDNPVCFFHYCIVRLFQHGRLTGCLLLTIAIDDGGDYDIDSKFTGSGSG